MHLQIDNYYVSVSGDYIKVCIDGQNIIHEKFTEEQTVGNATKVAVKLIEDYNNRHECKWGELDY